MNVNADLDAAVIKLDRRLDRTPFKSLQDFLGEYAPLSYALEPIVRSSSLYTLTAKTGHGKTGFLVTAAYAVATGRQDLLGCDVMPGRVAYLAMENGDDVRMRMLVTAFRLNIDPRTIGDEIVVLDKWAKPEDALARLRAGDWGEFRLIIGDTLASMFDGDDINNAVQGGDFMRRLRPFTALPGRPSVIVAAHPTKAASQETLVPYGSGAILNEVDGNLTLWKDEGVTSLHWQGKLRGLEFSPIPFRFDLCGSPDVVDARGRQVQIPVCVRTTVESAEERSAHAGARNLAVLRAMQSNPQVTQREIADKTGQALGTVNRTLAQLAAGKFIEKGADDRWRLSPKGRREIGA